MSSPASSSSAAVVVTLWRREITRFWRDRFKAVAFLLFPILWVLFFGAGLGSAFIPRAALTFPDTFHYFDYLLPGIAGLTVSFTAIFSAVTFVTDREFGYLREVLVSPASRLAIVLGKVFGGMTVAFGEGVLMLLVLPLAGIRWTLPGVFGALPVLALMALMLAAVGIAIASFIHSTEAFPVFIQLLFLPLLLLSGALFPLADSPHWMQWLSFVNPATYGMDALRHVTLTPLHLPAEVIARLGVTINGFVIPLWLDGVILVGVTFIALVFAAWRITRTP